MSKSYSRCQFIKDKQQCDNWFAVSDENFKHCPVHAESGPPLMVPIKGSNGNGQESTSEYHRISDLATAEVADLSIEEIEKQIANHEAIIQAEKIKIQAKRAVNASKLSKLSDDERAELRKHKVQRALEAPKKPTMKSDPIGYLMEKMGISRENAIKILGDD